MKKEQVDALMGVIGPTIGAFTDLHERVLAAERIFERHSADLFREYQQEVQEAKRRGNQTQNAIALENLTKLLLEE